jgi:hypothetical protein
MCKYKVKVCEVRMTNMIDNLEQSLMHMPRIFKRQLKNKM